MAHPLPHATCCCPMGPAACCCGHTRRQGCAKVCAPCKGVGCHGLRDESVVREAQAEPIVLVSMQVLPEGHQATQVPILAAPCDCRGRPSRCASSAPTGAAPTVATARWPGRRRSRFLCCPAHPPSDICRWGLCGPDPGPRPGFASQLPISLSARLEPGPKGAPSQHTTSATPHQGFS